MTDRDFLDLAARAAFRAMGDVEPNPMVGAVLVKAGVVIGIGHHRRFGGPHAEREALADARARGHDPHASTAYVTLEPCSHHGKTPPCTDALIEAGVARVVAARPDPNPVSAGGARALRVAGIPCDFCGDSDLALRVGDPFVKRTTTTLPFVIAKWAQFHDGRIVTRPDEDRWISGPAARRRVHRLRARVDAILTGIGTVLADDPLLTARDVARVRRVARRVVLDPSLRTPSDAALVRTAGDTPTIIACTRGADPARAADLRSRGVEVVEVPSNPDGLDLHALLRRLARAHHLTTILTEAGPRLLASLFAARFVDLALIHTAPGPDPRARPLLPAFVPPGWRTVRERALARDNERVLAPPPGSSIA